MSDRQDWGNAPSGGFPPVPHGQQFPPPTYPPAGPPGQFGPPSAYAGGPPQYGPPPRKSKRWLWIGGAAAVVVVLLVVGAVFAFVGSGRDAGGADSPQAAVLDCLAAAEKNDAFAAANLLDPAERAGIRQVLENARDTAQKTDYQQGGGDNGLLQGVQVTSDNVHTAVTNIRDDLARVEITDGEITLGFDPAKSNPGLREFLDELDTEKRTWTVDDLTKTSDNGDPVTPAVMTVRRGGKWYISVLYSYLDLVARHEDKPPVSDPQPVDTQSYATPEEAAQGFVDGLVSTLASGDIGPVSRTLSPHSGTLIATYRSLFSDLDPQDVTVVGTPQFSATTRGNTATVTVDDLTIQHDDDGDVETIRFHGDCITSNRKTNCDPGELNYRSAFLFSPRSNGVIATRDDKGWHVDPVSTYLHSLAEMLRNATKGEVAVLLAESFDSPKAYLQLDTQGELKAGDTKTVTPDPGSSTGLGVVAFDLPVKAGDRVGIAVASDSGDQFWRVVGKSGEIAKGDADEYPDAEFFDAPDTETLKVVVVGRSDEPVTIAIAN